MFDHLLNRVACMSVGEDISEHRDGGVTRRVIRKGEGYRTPNEGATVDGMCESAVRRGLQQVQVWSLKVCAKRMLFPFKNLFGPVAVHISRNLILL